MFVENDRSKIIVDSILNDKNYTPNEKIDALANFLGEFGYFIQSRSEHFVQFRKPKTFSFVSLIFWTAITFGIGFIPYILYYLSRKDTIKTYTV